MKAPKNNPYSILKGLRSSTTPNSPNEDWRLSVDSTATRTSTTLVAFPAPMGGRTSVASAVSSSSLGREAQILETKNQYNKTSAYEQMVVAGIVTPMDSDKAAEQSKKDSEERAVIKKQKEDKDKIEKQIQDKKLRIRKLGYSMVALAVLMILSIILFLVV